MLYIHVCLQNCYTSQIDMKVRKLRQKNLTSSSITYYLQLVSVDLTFPFILEALC
jgi:hypothetical protein